MDRELQTPTWPVFDPFYTTKPVGKGTGLGLSICYGIIKKIGGDINVSSTKGEGHI
jgi:two-component system NtrC family sensor kinase